ncbi:MAG: sporulation protein YabP [Oscillospiraceae bacterium]|nr:sporulation protein YabP [Oscillospiraceae bacterium]
MAEQKQSSKSHTLNLSNRKLLKLTGVNDVGNFDDKTVVVYTDLGELSVKGRELRINNLNLEKSELFLEGEIDSLFYSQNISPNTSFFSKIFR